MVRKTLWINGLTPETTARALGQEFEKFGPLVRCDIPSARGGSAYRRNMYVR